MIFTFYICGFQYVGRIKSSAFVPSLHFVSQRRVEHDGAQPDHEERGVRGDEPLLETLFHKSGFGLVQRVVISEFQFCDF